MYYVGRKKASKHEKKMATKASSHGRKPKWSKKTVSATAYMRTERKVIAQNSSSLSLVVVNGVAIIIITIVVVFITDIRFCATANGS